MTPKLLFFILAAICIVLLILGLKRKHSIYEFQVLFVGAFAFSILPQLVNHVFRPGRLPTKVYSDHGVEWGIVVCILCLLAGWLGTTAPVRRLSALKSFVPDAAWDKLWWPGVVLCLIGTYGNWKVDQLLGGFQARFMQGEQYAIATTGAITIYLYLAKLQGLGILFCFFSVLKNGSFMKWAFVLLMLVYPIASVVYLGRRTSVVAISLMFGLGFWFKKRWAPPRLVSIAGMALAGFLIIFLPYYRQHSSQTGRIRESLSQVAIDEGLDAYWAGDKGEGMDNLIVGVVARMSNPSFGFGAGFWDNLIDFYVPAQLVGRETKNRLFLNISKSDTETFSEYCGYLPELDSYLTGPYSTYIEFWFFGCFVFYLMARFYKRLWLLANEEQHSGAQLLYTATILFGPFSVVASVADCFARFLLSSVVVWVALSLAGGSRLVADRPGRFRKARNRRRQDQAVIHD